MKKIIFLYLILIILLCINVSLAQDISINPNQVDPNNSKEIDPNQNNKYHKVYWFVNEKKVITMWLDENDEPVNSVKEKGIEKISDGILKMYNDKGVLISEGDLKNGLLSGIIKDYYDNGNLKMKQPMQNGKREGITRKYFRGGGIEAEYSYKNNRLDGISKEYCDNGTPNVIENYKNDKLDGIRKLYTEDGKLITAYQYKDGIMTPGVDGYKNFKWGMTKGQILKSGVCDLKNFASGCLLSEKFLRAHPSLESLRGFGEDALICDNFSFGKGQVLAVFYFIDKKLQRIKLIDLFNRL